MVEIKELVITYDFAWSRTTRVRDFGLCVMFTLLLQKRSNVEMYVFSVIWEFDGHSNSISPFYTFLWMNRSNFRCQNLPKGKSKWHVRSGLNSHYFHIIGDKLINPIVKVYLVYIPIIRSSELYLHYIRYIDTHIYTFTNDYGEYPTFTVCIYTDCVWNLCKILWWMALKNGSECRAILA